MKFILKYFLIFVLFPPVVFGFSAGITRGSFEYLKLVDFKSGEDAVWWIHDLHNVVNKPSPELSIKTLSLYVSSFANGGHQPGEGIIRIDIDTETYNGEKYLVAPLDNPGYLLSDETTLYAASEILNGKLYSFGYGPDGILNEMSSVTSDANPIYISKDVCGEHLFIANYGGYDKRTAPSSAVMRILERDGSIISHPMGIIKNTDNRITSIVPLSLSANCKLNKGNTFVYATDLDKNSIHIYEITYPIKEMIHHKTIMLPYPKGEDHPMPEEAVISKNGKYLYVLDQGTSSVMLFSINSSTGDIKQLDTIKTTKHLDRSEKNYPSSLVINDKYNVAYIGNRGVNTISIFEIDPTTGRLTYISEHRSQWPKSLSLSRDNQFLAVANQTQGIVQLFKANRTYLLLVNEYKIHSPVAVEFK